MRRRSYTAARLAGIPAPTPAVAQPVSPLGQALAALATAIADGTIQPCPVCGRFDCDHDEWHEIMFTDPIELSNQPQGGQTL
jgi:hypothetical protein